MRVVSRTAPGNSRLSTFACSLGVGENREWWSNKGSPHEGNDEDGGQLTSSGRGDSKRLAAAMTGYPVADLHVKCEVPLTEDGRLENTAWIALFVDDAIPVEVHLFKGRRQCLGLHRS